MYCFHACFLRSREVFQAPLEKGDKEAYFPLQRLNGTCMVAFFFFLINTSVLELLKRIKINENVKLVTGKS